MIEALIRTAVKGLTYFLIFDNTEELSKDLQNDELVKRELSLISGQLVLRGGRFVALGSGLFHVIKHIDFSTKESKSDIENYQGVYEHKPPPILREENFKRSSRDANKKLSDCQQNFNKLLNKISIESQQNSTDVSTCQHFY